MRANEGLVLTAAIAIGLFACTARAADEIEVPSALIKIVESVDIPAANSGVLAKVLVREGDIIEMGDLLAQLDDRSVQLQRSEAQLDAQIAKKEAKNDVLARLARKTHELAMTELQRALNVNKGIPNSVSDRELNVLRLTVDKSALEIEQAEHNRQVAELNLSLKQAELELAQHEVSRFAIRSPLPGMVVHVDKRPGEWVSTGDLVVRVVRIDYVRAEGFVSAEQAATALQNRAARIRVNLPGIKAKEVLGTVVFVSPEANPVDGRVRIWAEFKNKGFVLRPGLRGTIRIAMDGPGAKAATARETRTGSSP